MAFRGIDLAKLMLRDVVVHRPLSDRAWSRLFSTVFQGDGKATKSADGFLRYSAGGKSYVAILRVLRFENRQLPGMLHFRIRLEDDDTEERTPNYELTREQVEEALQATAVDEPWANSLVSGQFVLPEGDFESPLLPRIGAIDDESEAEREEADRLLPSGVRFTSKNGLRDLLIDASPGPLMVSVKTELRSIGSTADFRGALRDLYDYAMLFVHPSETSYE